MGTKPSLLHPATVRLAAAVNNVGSNVRKPTLDYTEEDFQFVFNTNLQSAFVLTQMAHPLLKAAGSGVVLFNSSVAGGPISMRSGVLYAMTKAAMNQLARNLSVEWAQDSIRVNAVCPWYTATDLAMQVRVRGGSGAGTLVGAPCCAPRRLAGVARWRLVAIPPSSRTSSCAS